MNGQSGTKLQKDCSCAPVDVSLVAEVSLLAVIQELVQRFHVCWLTLPDVVLAGRDKHRIGFPLELQTAHEHREKDSARDCAHCQRARAVLRIVAEHIVRCANRSCACAVEIEMPFVSLATMHGNQGVLKLALRLVHRSECHQPADCCETRWLQEMGKCLKDLGAIEAGHE